MRRGFAFAIMAVLLLGIAPAPSDITLHVYTRAELREMPKERLAELAFQLQRRAILAEAGPSPSTLGDATQQQNGLSFTSGSINVTPTESATTESSKPKAAIRALIALIGAAALSSIFLRHSSAPAQHWLPPEVRRVQAATGSVAVTPLTPTQSGTCNVVTGLNAAYVAFRGQVFANEKYAVVTVTPAPSPGAAAAATAIDPSLVQSGKSQRATDEAISGALGLASNAASCGVSGNAQISPGPAETAGTLRSLPFANTTTTSTTSLIGPSPKQAWCNSLTFVAQTWKSDGPDWIEDVPSNKSIATDAGRNNNYSILSAVLAVVPPSINCNGLTPTQTATNGS